MIPRNTTALTAKSEYEGGGTVVAFVVNDVRAMNNSNFCRLLAPLSTGFSAMAELTAFIGGIHLVFYAGNQRWRRWPFSSVDHCDVEG